MQSIFHLTENSPSTEAKWDITNATDMHLQDDLDQVKETGGVTILNELEHNLISALILEI
jgi:hypothetical protein